MPEAGVVRSQSGFNEFIAVQINKRNLAMFEFAAETGFVQEEFSVAVMSRAFSHENDIGPQSPEGFGRSADKVSISINRFLRDVFDQIRLEEYGFALNIQVEEPDAIVNEVVEFV